MSAFFFRHPRETDLALFAGGEMGLLGRWRVERHLRRCATCKRAVADYFHLESELAALAETPDLDWDRFAARIEAAVAAAAPTPPKPSFVPAWGAAGAALAATALAAFLLVEPPAPTPEIEEPLAALADAAPTPPPAAPEPSASTATPEPSRASEARSAPVRADSPARIDEAPPTTARLAGDLAAPPPPPAPSAAPGIEPAGEGAYVEIAADGWVSYRAYSPDTGILTVTEVYAP